MLGGREALIMSFSYLLAGKAAGGGACASSANGYTKCIVLPFKFIQWASCLSRHGMKKLRCWEKLEQKLQSCIQWVKDLQCLEVRDLLLTAMYSTIALLLQ